MMARAIGGVVVSTALAACASNDGASAAACKPAATPVVIQAGEARISVRTVGQGAPGLLIPSLGRGAGDFDALAQALAARGFMAILPDPRNIDGSTGPAPKTLADLADDAAAVIAHLCEGPVDVVGHAFGQRVARQLAARHPDKVPRLTLLAAGGRVAMPEDVRASLVLSVSQGAAPDAARLDALRHVFFARGMDAALWLDGWTPLAAQQQSAATQASAVEDWWSGGDAEMLVVQAGEDPIAPAQNSEALRSEFGARVRVVELAHASHAMLPEQPDAIAAVVIAWLRGETREAELQRAIDTRLRRPLEADRK